MEDLFLIIRLNQELVLQPPHQQEGLYLSSFTEFGIKFTIREDGADFQAQLSDSTASAVVFIPFFTPSGVRTRQLSSLVNCEAPQARIHSGGINICAVTWRASPRLKEHADVVGELRSGLGSCRSSLLKSHPPLVSAFNY